MVSIGELIESYLLGVMLEVEVSQSPAGSVKVFERYPYKPLSESASKVMNFMVVTALK